MIYDDLIRDISHCKVGFPHTLYIIGNGGSAAQADHLVGELIPSGVRAIALTNPAVMSAIANDYGVEKIFSIPVLCLSQPNDVLLCLTTSNESKNIRSAQWAGKARRMNVYTITGRNAPDHNNSKLIRVASENTQGIQEETLAILHDIYLEFK